MFMDHFIFFIMLNQGLWVSCREFNITDLLPCISYITHDYNQKTDFLFITEELKQIEPKEKLFKEMPGALVIQRTEQFAERYGFFILFPDTYKSYEPLLKIIQSSSYNKFLINFLSCNSSRNSLSQFFEQFWNFKILNVIILCQVSPNIIHLYNYNPFQKLYCNEPNLKRLNIWNIPQKTFVHSYNMFKEVTDFKGCPLICLAKNRPPDALVRQANRKWELDGVGGKLMDELKKRFNFDAVIEVPKMNVSVDKYGYDISGGYPELVSSRLKNYTVDLAFGIYSHIIYDHLGIEFSAVSVFECYGWAVPANMGGEISPWMYYIQEFHHLVWIIILLVYLASIFIIYISSHLRCKDSVFHQFDFSSIYSLSLLLGISVSPRLSAVRGRIFIGGFVLYSLIISAAYQSSLGSFLTVPWKHKQIETFQEIVDAKYIVVGSPQPGRILQRLSMGNPALEDLSQRFQIHTDHVGTLVRRIQSQKDTVTFAAQRFIQFYISNELNNNEKSEIYLLPECVIQAHASPFLFNKGSTLIKPVNQIILRSVEAGLTKYWFTYSTPRITMSLFSEIFPLSIDQVRAAFVVLLFGLFVAILVFCSEVTYKFKKHPHM